MILSILKNIHKKCKGAPTTYYLERLIAASWQTGLSGHLPTGAVFASAPAYIESVSSLVIRIDGQVYLVRLQTDNFRLFLQQNGQATNYRLYDE